MQIRVIDRGAVFNFKTWKNFFGGMLAPGVYYGFDLSLDASGNIRVGQATHSSTRPGALMLPSGIGLLEDNPFSIAVQLPGGPTNYTIAVRHIDNELIGGDSATYYVTEGLLTEQPSDGTILGWIRYDGSGMLTQAMITPAPLLRADLPHVGANVELSPPNPVIVLASGADERSGVDGTSPPFSWRGVRNLATAAPLQSVGYVQWRVKSPPFRILVNLASDPANQSLWVDVLDTTGTSVMAGGSPVTVLGSLSFVEQQVLIPQGVGTWTLNGTATLKLTYNTPQATTIKINRLVVDNWPFALPPP